MTRVAWKSTHLSDLGFTMQFNAETPWPFAELRYPQSDSHRSNNSIKHNSILSHVRDLMSNTLLSVV